MEFSFRHFITMGNIKSVRLKMQSHLAWPRSA